MYLLAGLLAVEHAAASPCMLLAASSDADCESLCDGCRCAGGAWQVLEQHSHRTGQTSWFCASGGAGTEYTLVTPTGGAYRTLAAQQSCEVDVVSEMCSPSYAHPALGNAAYTNAALDTTTTLLTWSGSDYGNGEPSTCDLCGGACACSSEIPTTLVSLWFTTLTYRRC